MRLVFEGEAEFFDHRIGQNFASHAPDFGFCFRPGQPAIQGEFEILSLADFLQPL